jgi:hypothetical protein
MLRAVVLGWLGVLQPASSYLVLGRMALPGNFWQFAGGSLMSGVLGLRNGNVLACLLPRRVSSRLLLARS